MTARHSRLQRHVAEHSALLNIVPSHPIHSVRSEIRPHNPASTISSSSTLVVAPTTTPKNPVSVPKTTRIPPPLRQTHRGRVRGDDPEQQLATTVHCDGWRGGRHAAALAVTRDFGGVNTIAAASNAKYGLVRILTICYQGV
jgi:hypothetical protein